MAERTRWGSWLQEALRERGLKANDLAKQAGMSRSTISQLMAGNIKSVSAALREQIALALRIATEEVPLPSDFDEQPGSSPSQKFVPPPSYFAPGDEPPKISLQFIDHGIPDHLLPRLAWTKGYFEPFNITLSIDTRDQREYPEDQQSAFARTSSDTRILVSGPEEVFSDPDHPVDTSMSAFIARVNQYHGYALITKTDTNLQAVSSRDPFDKVMNFVRLMGKIENRNARSNAVFVDRPARDFYDILWSLYDEIQNRPISKDPDNEKAESENQERASEDSENVKVQSADEVSQDGLGAEKRMGLSKAYKRPVLDRLHEIGNLRADFIVGTADTVVLARSSGRYKVLITYRDVGDIIRDLPLSPNFMSNLTQRALAASSGRSAESGENGGSPDIIRTSNTAISDEQAYETFYKRFDHELEKLRLNNVWALNVPFRPGEASEALICRIAGVAFRTVELLRDLDDLQRNSNLQQLLSLLGERQGNDPNNSDEGYQALKLSDFIEVWKESYSLYSYEETSDWLQKKTGSPTEGGIALLQESLREVMRSMEGKRKIARKLIDDLTGLQSLPQSAEEHLIRARHHYSIYSYWDAARYAEKAEELASDVSVRSGGGSDG